MALLGMVANGNWPHPSPRPQPCWSPRPGQSAGTAWSGRSIWRQRVPRGVAGDCHFAAGHSACGCGWVWRREAQQRLKEREESSELLVETHRHTLGWS